MQRGACGSGSQCLTTIISCIVYSSMMISISNAAGIPDDCSSYSSVAGSSGTLCRATINGCKLCNLSASPKTCSQCLDGFYKSSNSCLSCTERYGSNVQTCIESSILTCSPQYYLINGACAACPTGCNTCSSASICITCADGYTLSADQLTCVQCANDSTHCCSIDPATGACNVCNPKYYFRSADQTCRNCFVHCTVCSDSTTCSQCATGYYYDSTNAACVQNPSNCSQVCSSSSSSSVKCIQCAQNYYADSNGVCQSCATLENCDQCGNLTACAHCVDSYMRIAYTSPSTGISTEKCYACDTNCSRCHLISNKKVCYECTNGSTPDTTTQSCVKALAITVTQNNDNDDTEQSNIAISLSYYYFSLGLVALIMI